MKKGGETDETIETLSFIAIYYGCADTVTGLAFGYISEIIEFTKKNSIV